MRAIFISYRRDDASGEAGRLFDDLVAKFGSDRVFMDVSGIEPGRDFRKVIDENVASCGVLLAVIGKAWVDAKDEHGQRRLDDPSDFVRLETGSALKRDVIVIPVLVRGAAMPRADQLPDDLKELAYRNGVELTHARWGSDVELLVKALRAHLGDLPSASGNRDHTAAARSDQPTPPAMPQWVSSGSDTARTLLSSRPAQIAAAAVLVIALTLYFVFGNGLSINDVESRDPLIANGKPHDLVVDFKPGKHEVKEIEVKFVRGDAPASSWTTKVSSQDSKQGRASVGPISYRSTKETSATFQYVLVASDGTRSKPYEKTFKLAAGTFQPPSISTVQVPNVMHVGQPYSFKLWYEAPDAEVVQVQSRIVESSITWPQTHTTYNLKGAARGTGSLTYTLPASQAPYKTTEEFVLVDALGNKSEPHRTSFEVLPATATAQNADRTRGQQSSRGAYGNASCFNCGTVIDVREVAQQANGAASAGALMGGLLGGALTEQSRRGQSNDAVAAGALGAIVGHQAAGGASRIYEITVRYDDGRSEVIRQSTAPRWRNGDRVQVVNGALRYAA